MINDLKVNPVLQESTMTTDDEVEILLVEDSTSDAELAIRALKKKNLANKLIHLKNGAEALDFIFGKGAYAGRDTKQVPKVILLDLKMPKVNGLEVLAKIKGDETTRSIPVVVLTSSNEDPDIAACYAMGVNSYIVKPVDFDNFVKAVSELGFYWLLLNQVPGNQKRQED
jgi:two-component system response regulator